MIQLEITFQKNPKVRKGKRIPLTIGVLAPGSAHALFVFSKKKGEGVPRFFSSPQILFLLLPMERDRERRETSRSLHKLRSN
jgi:hypothetical protein